MAHLTPRELASLADSIASGSLDIDSAMASLDEDDAYARQSLIPLVGYCAETNRRKAERAALYPAQRRGYVVLRSLLSAEQRVSLSRNGTFVLSLPSGNSYRFVPATGAVHLVERHGRNWCRRGHFCFHEAEPHSLPKADRTVAHLLLLLADESRFLEQANFTASDMWRVGWRRDLREAREEQERCARAELAAEGVDADRFVEALEARARGAPAPYLEELDARDRARWIEPPDEDWAAAAGVLALLRIQEGAA